jgi:4-hydroxy-tetrahydrodipicolinate synthase
MFHGSIVALVTPMHVSGDIDIEAWRRLIEYHIQAGTQGIVIAGTTGESPTLTVNEKLNLLKHAREQAVGRIPLILGTGTNCTRSTVELTRLAMQAGADACLLVTPYYNKPTQEGLYLHYLAVAKAVPIPQILYNVPGRSACDLLPETVMRLANIANIIGIKEATGNLERARILFETCGDKLDLYSGDDATAMEFMLNMGGKGVISVTANVAPTAMQQMCLAAIQGERGQAMALNETLMPLHKQLFIEANPIPTKWCLAEIGLIPPGIRLPLTPLSLIYQPTVRDALRIAIAEETV